MARSSRTTVTRRAGAVLATVVFATTAGLGAGAPADAASGGRGSGAAAGPAAATASCQQAQRTSVTQALDADKIPAEIVIIVDISKSMNSSNNNLYSTVSTLVPALVGALAQKYPQDLVAVITLGTQQNTQVVVNPGQPNRHTWVPPLTPNSDWSDFGRAFQEAISLFGDPPPGTAPQVGDVLLLSDGQVSDTIQDDPTYGGQAPAVFAEKSWQNLGKAAAKLPLQVTGFEVPLTSDGALQASQETALKHVFPHVSQLQYTSDLVKDPARTIQQIQTATTQDVQNTKIESAAAPDNGAGVQVTWSSLPGSRGRLVDLGKPGRADVRITLRARTQRVPLCLSHLAVTSAGFPVRMRGVDLPASIELPPGGSVTRVVTLTWPGGSSGITWWGPRAVPGHLAMTATLSSPYESVISPVDTGFSYGDLLGGATPFTADVPPVITIVELLGLAILVLLIGFACWLAWMGGELILATGVEPLPGTKNASGYPSVSLWGLRRSHQIANLHGKPARLTASGSLRRRDIKIRIKVDGKRWTKVPVWLPRGGTRNNIAGVSIHHQQDVRGRRFRWRRRAETDDAGS